MTNVDTMRKYLCLATSRKYGLLSTCYRPKGHPGPHHWIR